MICHGEPVEPWPLHHPGILLAGAYAVPGSGGDGRPTIVDALGSQADANAVLLAAEKIRPKMAVVVPTG